MTLYGIVGAIVLLPVVGSIVCLAVALAAAPFAAARNAKRHRRVWNAEAKTYEWVDKP